MIIYNRSAFGWKLIFRFHGSAFYRSVLPSCVAVILYFIYGKYITQIDDDGEKERDLLHPYAVGVLVTTSTFLIVFRLNQSYSRYWEACGNVHQCMSKWMDATTHTGIYHLQCDHYRVNKPPSFYDYPELNSLFMTRDRERSNIHTVHQGDNSVGYDGHGSDSSSGFIFGKPFQRPTSQGTIPEIPQPQRFGGLNIDSSGDSEILRGKYGRKSISTGSTSRDDSRKRHREEIREEYQRRAFAKSINHLDTKYKQKAMKRYSTDRNRRGSVSSLYSICSKSTRHINMKSVENNDLYEESVFHSFGSEPIPLVGKPRLDGNWGAYYTKNPKQPLSTYVNPHRVDNVDPTGFASVQGDRTPPLFLQELAHLSSLMNAVALSTLRNDMEGCESPLSIYEPGQQWPEVDPNQDEILKVHGTDAFFAWINTFLGVGLSAEQRSKHNAAQPLPVIGGVSDAEIRFLQMAKGPYAKTQLCFNWLSEFIVREHLAGTLGEVGPPIISRVFQFLGDGMIYYNHARKIMFIPFPFGHAQLSVIFLFVMKIVIPYLMHDYTDHPVIGGLLTFLTVVCLEGINEVARDLENPFRNYPNELPLVNFQAQYNEGLITMFAGYHPDFFWDGDQVLRSAESSGRGMSRKKQENVDCGLESKSPSDGYINNITFNVKPQKADDIAPLNTGGGDAAEVTALKLQLEYQAKLIEQLFAKVGDIHGKEL